MCKGRQWDEWRLVKRRRCSKGGGTPPAPDRCVHSLSCETEQRKEVFIFMLALGLRTLTHRPPPPLKSHSWLRDRVVVPCFGGCTVLHASPFTGAPFCRWASALSTPLPATRVTLGHCLREGRCWQSGSTPTGTLLATVGRSFHPGPKAPSPGLGSPPQGRSAADGPALSLLAAAPPSLPSPLRPQVCWL